MRLRYKGRIKLYFTWQSAILVLSIADYFLEAFMANTLKLPVGIENFEEIRKLGFYYIDKTRLIEQLLQDGGRLLFLPALAVLVRLSI